MKNIYVAKLGKTVGLNGQIKIHIDSDFPEQFKKDASFLLKNNTTLKIQSFNKDRDIVKFYGYETIDEVKKLVNQEIFSTQELTKENCKLEEKQFFWFEVIGCSVYENDLLLGKVKDIHRYPITDYLEITTDTNLVEKELPKTFLLPYSDDFIIDVNIDDKVIKVNKAFDILENS